uniref:Uncharacterized protein n=1 Tax=uncultured marine virus TaxID=186617 RepID=A0A0F7L6N0_9VIRU|nr:hypothetical protein [uncultured marine virus]
MVANPFQSLISFRDACSLKSSLMWLNCSSSICLFLFYWGHQHLLRRGSYPTADMVDDEISGTHGVSKCQSIHSRLVQGLPIKELSFQIFHHNAPIRGRKDALIAGFHLSYG